jgi:hypothetical protein
MLQLDPRRGGIGGVDTCCAEVRRRGFFGVLRRWGEEVVAGRVEILDRPVLWRRFLVLVFLVAVLGHFLCLAVSGREETRVGLF